MNRKDIDDLCIVGKSPFHSYIENEYLETNDHNNCIGNGILLNHKSCKDEISVPKSSSCWYLNDYHVDKDLKFYQSLKTLDQIGKQINSLKYDNCEKVIDIVTPVDTDEDARKYFPVTLGKACEVKAQIHSDKSPPWTLTFSPPSNGLPMTSSPWRVPTIHNRSQLTKKWIPTEKHLENNLHFLISSNNSTLNDERLAAIQTPFHAELSKLRLDRLRLEDEIIMEVKRQEELERIRGPEPKWYELRDERFHYEARKNNELLKSCENWQKLFDYRNSLMKKSDEFHDKYSGNKRYDPTDYIPVL